ncbi:MAG: hypothetical protein AAFX87_25305 [Bacteroidota bacterium]
MATTQSRQLQKRKNALRHKLQADADKVSKTNSSLKKINRDDDDVKNDTDTVQTSTSDGNTDGTSEQVDDTSNVTLQNIKDPSRVLKTLDNLIPRGETESEVKENTQRYWAYVDNFHEIYGIYPWEVVHTLHPKDRATSTATTNSNNTQNAKTLARDFLNLQERIKSMEKDFKSLPKLSSAPKYNGPQAEKVNDAIDLIKKDAKEARERAQQNRSDQSLQDTANNLTELAETAEYTARLFQYMHQNAQQLGNRITNDFQAVTDSTHRDQYLQEMADLISAYVTNRGLWTGQEQRAEIIYNLNRPEDFFRQGYNTLGQTAQQAVENNVSLQNLLANLSYNLEAKSYGRRVESLEKLRNETFVQEQTSSQSSNNQNNDATNKVVSKRDLIENYKDGSTRKEKPLTENTLPDLTDILIDNNGKLWMVMDISENGEYTLKPL